MTVNPIKVNRLYKMEENLFDYIVDHLISLKENDIVAITSKIVSISEFRAFDSQDVISLAKENCDSILKEMSHEVITIVNQIPMPNSGIDKSNGDSKILLLPEDVNKTASIIRKQLSKKYGVKNIGVIITDSELSNFRNGSIGYAIGYSGFKGYKDYRGIMDLYGRTMHVSVSNIVDKIASSAVFVMGEGDERIPLALISNLHGIEFNEQYPTEKEIEILKKDITKFPFNV